MSDEQVETVVIGAGQQGCGVAAALRDLGHDAIVLERGEIGQAWARERWDSLVVGSGNRSVCFPGWEYDGDDPDGRMPGREVARYLRRYVRERELRVRQQVLVRAVECLAGNTGQDGVRFRTRFAGGAIRSRNVVAALGGYAKPRIPGSASDIGPRVRQLHSRHYRNPAALPEGAVLVVGCGISGQEIAGELIEAGRRVFLSVGRHRSVPRCYRGRPLHDWFSAFSLYDDYVERYRRADQVGGQPVLQGLPVVGTRPDGADLNLGTLAARGATLVGSILAAQGETLSLAGNVGVVAAEAARFFDGFLDRIDTGIEHRGFVVPPQSPRPAVDLEGISEYGGELELLDNGISTIVWCTGFGPDYRILPDDLLDGEGFPIHQEGIFGATPGLYYAGLPNGDNLHQTGIPSCVENARYISRQIHIDHVLRTDPAAPLFSVHNGL